MASKDEREFDSGLTGGTDVPALEEDFSLEEILAEYGGGRERKILADVERAVAGEPESAPEPPPQPEAKAEVKPEPPADTVTEKVPRTDGSTLETAMTVREPLSSAPAVSRPSSEMAVSPEEAPSTCQVTSCRTFSPTTSAFS